MNLNQEFWDERYKKHETGWDLGEISRPLQAYFDGLENQQLRILIPGCGRGYEAEYLWRKGFEHVHVLDWSHLALADFQTRVPDFPSKNLHVGDFFSHQGEYELMVEQTFFCALDPVLRQDYARHVHGLIKPGGHLMGLLFNDPLNDDRHPFGGNQAEYQALLEPYFRIIHLDEAYNSITPRAGRELFLLAEKPELP